MYMTLLLLSRLLCILKSFAERIYLLLSGDSPAGRATHSQFTILVNNVILKGNTMSIVITQDKAVQISLAFFDKFENPTAKPEGAVDWVVLEASGGTGFSLEPATAEAVTATFKSSVPGVYTVTATCGGLTSTVEIEVNAGEAVRMEMVTTVIEPVDEPVAEPVTEPVVGETPADPAPL